MRFLVCSEKKKKLQFNKKTEKVLAEKQKKIGNTIAIVNTGVACKSMCAEGRKRKS